MGRRYFILQQFDLAFAVPQTGIPSVTSPVPEAYLASPWGAEGVKGAKGKAHFSREKDPPQICLARGVCPNPQSPRSADSLDASSGWFPPEFPVSPRVWTSSWVRVRARREEERREEQKREEEAAALLKLQQAAGADNANFTLLESN